MAPARKKRTSSQKDYFAPHNRLLIAILLFFSVLLGIYLVSGTSLFGSEANRAKDDFNLNVYYRGTNPLSPKVRLIAVGDKPALWRSVGPLEVESLSECTKDAFSKSGGVTKTRYGLVELDPSAEYAGLYCFEAQVSDKERYYSLPVFVSEEMLLQNANYSPQVIPLTVKDTDYDWGLSKFSTKKIDRQHREHLDNNFSLLLRTNGEYFVEARIFVPPKLVLKDRPDVKYIATKDSSLTFITVSDPGKCKLAVFRDKQGVGYRSYKNPQHTTSIPLVDFNYGKYLCFKLKIKGEIRFSPDTHPEKVFVTTNRLPARPKNKDWSLPRFAPAPYRYKYSIIEDTNYDFGLTKSGSFKEYRSHLDDYFRLYSQVFNQGEGLTKNRLFVLERPPRLKSTIFDGSAPFVTELEEFKFKKVEYGVVDASSRLYGNNPSFCGRAFFEQEEHYKTLDLKDGTSFSLPQTNPYRNPAYCVKVYFKAGLNNSFDAHGYRIFYVPEVP